MNITVITGSPNKKGSSALLADEFIRGAGEGGHRIFRFDAAFETVGPCLACVKCGRGSAECVRKDAMLRLYPELEAADLVVFATPLYYFGMSAQLKAVVDRFFGINAKLVGSGKRAVLLAAGTDSEPWAMAALNAHYEAVLRYLKWQSAGAVLALGCNAREVTEKTNFPAQAYALGREIGK